MEPLPGPPSPEQHSPAEPEQFRAEEELERFFTLSLDMCCIAGNDGYFKRLNPAWEKTLGWTRAELMAQPYLSFVHPDDRDSTVSEARKLAEGGETFFFENRYRCKNGSYKWLLWSATPFPSKGLVYASARDVTEPKHAAMELRLAKEAAEAANRAKSRFLANMSHELRTPLNSVIGFANILLKNKPGNLTALDLTFLGRILDNGKHLLGLINQVLDLAKVEAGRMELDLAPVALDIMVRDVVEQCEGQLRGKPVELVADVPAPVAPIETDGAKLKQVLINLVGNAIKFTDQGRVTVRLRVDPATRQPVRLSVIDMGIGIPKNRQAAIFEAFQQADSGTSRKYGGTGLGLAISRSLCRLMGYRLEVASEVGRGSTFSILMTSEAEAALPGVDAVPASSAGQPEEAAAGRDLLKDKLVLVIDDKLDARYLLAQLIEEFGCKVLMASSGEQGLRLAREYRPHLITLDLLMPEMDGWQVLKELKADPALRRVPVVAISIIASENRGALLGAVDVLDKPVSRDDLERVLQRHLRSDKRKVLIVEDNEDARRLMSAYLGDGIAIQTAANGLEALQVLERFTPDLVLLDLVMPRMDGTTFLKALRQDPRHQHVPVVVVTAKELTPDEVRSLATEASAVLKKGEGLEEDLKRTLGECVPSQQLG